MQRATLKKFEIYNTEVSVQVKAQQEKEKILYCQRFCNKKILANLLNLSRVGEVTISVGNVFHSLQKCGKKHLENWDVEWRPISNAMEFTASEYLVNLAGW